MEVIKACISYCPKRSWKDRQQRKSVEKSQPPRRESKPESLEYKAKILTTQRQRSVEGNLPVEVPSIMHHITTVRER
jgi:hypothetical protein